MSNNLKKMVKSMKSISIKIIQFKNYLIYLTKCRSLDQRYEVAVEVRNNLVAASQNLQGSERERGLQIVVGELSSVGGEAIDAATDAGLEP